MFVGEEATKRAIAEALHVAPEAVDLSKYEINLHEFRDGSRKMFRRDQVEMLLDGLSREKTTKILDRESEFESASFSGGDRLLGTKMFVKESEAAFLLGKSNDQVKALGACGQLQEFRDRNELLFKSEQVLLLLDLESPAIRARVEFVREFHSSRKTGNFDAYLGERLRSDPGLFKRLFSSEVEPLSLADDFEPGLLALEDDPGGSGLLSIFDSDFELSDSNEDTALGADLFSGGNFDERDEISLFDSDGTGLSLTLEDSSLLGETGISLLDLSDTSLDGEEGTGLFASPKVFLDDVLPKPQEKDLKGRVSVGDTPYRLSVYRDSKDNGIYVTIRHKDRFDEVARFELRTGGHRPIQEHKQNGWTIESSGTGPELNLVFKRTGLGSLFTWKTRTNVEVQLSARDEVEILLGNDSASIRTS